MVQYTYVLNNPLLYADPLGMGLALIIDQEIKAMVSAYNFTNNSVKVKNGWS